MNIIKLESLQPLLHMLTDEHLTLIVQQNLGPRVIGIKVHLRQSKGTLALWKPIRNTKFDEIQVLEILSYFFVFSEDINFSLQWLGISTLATQLLIYCNTIFSAKYIPSYSISEQNRIVFTFRDIKILISDGICFCNARVEWCTKIFYSMHL